MPNNQIQPIIFSAPFGNYLSGKGITSTLGTFTLLKRAGFWKRWWRVLKTVRYNPLRRSWVNKLGLPSPGLEWLTNRVNSGKIDPTNKIISFHGFSTVDWREIGVRVMLDYPHDKLPLAFELNFSCPNVKDAPIDYCRVVDDFLDFCHKRDVDVIVKLPPINWQPIFEATHDAGARTFHCCNTLPVKRGGMSGKPLKPIVLEVIRSIKQMAPDVNIIGGGGITSEQDIRDYHAAGARRFAIASGLFNPFTLAWARSFARNLERSRRLSLDLT